MTNLAELQKRAKWVEEQTGIPVAVTEFYHPILGEYVPDSRFEIRLGRVDDEGNATVGTWKSAAHTVDEAHTFLWGVRCAAEPARQA